MATNRAAKLAPLPAASNTGDSTRCFNAFCTSYPPSLCGRRGCVLQLYDSCELRDLACTLGDPVKYGRSGPGQPKHPELSGSVCSFYPRRLAYK